MKIEQLFKIFTIMLVTVTLPLSQSYAAVSDYSIPNYELPASGGSGSGGGGLMPTPFYVSYTAPIVNAATEFIRRIEGMPMEAPASPVTSTNPTTSNEEIPGVVSPADTPISPLGELPMDGNLEGFQFITLDDSLVDDAAGEQEGFWSRRKVATTTGLLILTGLIIGLLAMGGGGGSGSGGGGEGGAGGGGGVVPFGFGPEGGDPEGEGNPQNPGGEGGPGGPGGEGIPTNPEPSTMFLFALGLLLPFLRKKK